MLNKKGYMLVEIVVSFSILMVIVIYLLNMTIKLKNMNQDNYQEQIYVSTSTYFTENVMEDLSDERIISVNIKDVNNKRNIDFMLENGDKRRLSYPIDTNEMCKDNQGKCIVVYCNVVSDVCDYNHESYFKKEFDSSLVIGKPETKLSADGSSYTLLLPLSSLYSDNIYDLKIKASIKEIPVIKSVDASYSGEIWNYKKKIKKIIFEGELNRGKHSNVGDNFIFDISSIEGSKTVMAYLEKNPDNTYNCYIQGDGIVYANEDSSNLFDGFENLLSFEGLEYFNTSKVVNMKEFFKDNMKIEFIDISKFDTSKVMYLDRMFHGCENLKQINFGNVDFKKVKTMIGLFAYDFSLENVDLSRVSFSGELSSMKGMFEYASVLKNINFGNINTSNVTDMSYLFLGCHSLQTLDVSKFDTKNVTTMKEMFRFGMCASGRTGSSSCESSMKELNLNSFDTRNVTDMSRMFSYAHLKTLTLSNKFVTSKVTNMNSMFLANSELESLNISHFDFSKVTDVSSMFHSCSKLTATICINKASIANYSSIFNNTSNLSGKITVNYTSASSSLVDSMISNKVASVVVKGSRIS